MYIEDKDYIIVGSGPGGATVAKELSERKKKVLILAGGESNLFYGRAGVCCLPNRCWDWYEG